MHGVVWCNIMECGKCGVLKFGVVWYNVLWCGEVIGCGEMWCGSVRCSGVWCCPIMS